VAFDQSRLVEFSPALRRNLIRRAAESLRPDSRDFGFEALERATAFAESSDAQRIDFVNGLYLFTESGKLYLAAYEADLPSAQWPQVSNQLSVIGNQCELGNGWILAVESVSLDTSRRLLDPDNWTAWLDADLTGSSLTVRSRRAGDRFNPLGMESGSVKLSDFFVNVKLPRRARTQWPLVCVGEEIAWVPGFRLAHPFRVTSKTERTLHLEIKRLPGT
jgi:tRNA(Ile)-lysidine synthase